MRTQKQAADASENEPTPTFSETLAAAAKQSGLGQLSPGETPSVRVLLGAIGGVRGIIESIVPGIAFLAIYLPTHNLLIAVLVPAFVALLLVVIRAGAKSSMSSAVTGAVLLAIMVTLQAALGIVTLLQQAPLSFALAHQMLAIIVFTIAVIHAERLAHHATVQVPQLVAAGLRT